MLTDIPLAHHYYLIPIEEFTHELLDEEYDVEKDAVFIGGQGILHELARDMDDDMLLAVTGLAGFRCMLVVNKDRDECVTRVEVARQAYDRKVAEYNERQKD